MKGKMEKKQLIFTVAKMTDITGISVGKFEKYLTR